MHSITEVELEVQNMLLIADAMVATVTVERLLAVVEQMYRQEKALESLKGIILSEISLIRKQSVAEKQREF